MGNSDGGSCHDVWSIDMNDREFERWLRRLTFGQKLDALLWGQRTIMYAQELDFEMELQQMQDLSRIYAKAAKITDVANALKTLTGDLLTERDALKKERDDLKAQLATGDAVDQAEIDKLETQLADVESTLEALRAVAAGTPVVLPPDTGGSVSGAKAGD